MTRVYVKLNGKDYRVSKYSRAGGDSWVEISITYEVMWPSDKYSVHPNTSPRTVLLDTNGRIGKKVLALAKAEGFAE